MADVAQAAGASKALLYHYFSTKSDLYLAAVRAAADELSAATRPDPDLPVEPRLRTALGAHLEWIDANALAYQAILQGAVSSAPDVRAIVEQSRAQVVARLAELFDGDLTPPQRIALRGWVGFLEGAGLDWLATKDMSRSHLTRLLVASLQGAIAASQVTDVPMTDDAVTVGR